MIDVKLCLNLLLNDTFYVGIKSGRLRKVLFQRVLPLDQSKSWTQAFCMRIYSTTSMM